MAKNSKDNKEQELLDKVRSGKGNVRDLITTFPESKECPLDEEE